VIKISQI